MGYVVTVTPREDRKARIAMDAEASHKTHPVKFRNKVENLKVVRLPVNLPVYRMRNGRTEDEQNQWLLDNPKQPKTYFSNGEEDVAPQREQHRILLEMSKDPNRPIYPVLEKERAQEEPLLVTVTGVVVNGNRRVAAMRDLLSRDPSTFSAFEFIDVAVLPPEANELDLDQIEVALQMAVETKLPYTWINQRLKMRHLMEDHKLSAPQIGALMNYQKHPTARVNAELQELALVEEYLDRYLKMPRNYKEVARSMQVFKEIEKRVSKKQGIQQDLAKGIAFAIVKGSAEAAEDRVYAYRESFGAHMERVIDRLVADLKIEAEAPPTQAQQSDDDPLAGLAQSAAPHHEKLLQRLNDPSEADELAKRIVQIHDSIKNENADDDRRTQALLDLRKSAQILGGVDMSSLDEKYYDDAREALELLSDRVRDLTQTLDSLSGEGATSAAA